MLRKALVLRRVIPIALVTALLSPLGCDSGAKLGKVRGTVKFKGKAVTEGTVTLLNLTEGGAAEANINPDGTFAIAHGVPLGEYVVEIKPLTEMRDTDPGKTPPAPVEKNAPDIPRKYRQQGTTPLKASVKEGDNEIHFEMTA